MTYQIIGATGYFSTFAVVLWDVLSVFGSVYSALDSPSCLFLALFFMLCYGIHVVHQDRVCDSVYINFVYFSRTSTILYGSVACLMSMLYVHITAASAFSFPSAANGGRVTKSSSPTVKVPSFWTNLSYSCLKGRYAVVSHLLFLFHPWDTK